MLSSKNLRNTWGDEISTYEREIWYVRMQGQAWCLMSIIPASWEAEMGRIMV
jgi:hypothetical protein